MEKNDKLRGPVPLIIMMILIGLSFSNAIPDEVNKNGSDENIRQLAYIEPGPIQKAIDPIDGSEIEMPTDILWTLFYNDYPHDYSQQEFEQFIKSRRIEQNKAAHRVIDNTSTDSDPKGLNIIFTIDSSVPTDAETALGEVELYLESMFQDPITVRINVDFSNMSGDVLGATAVYYINNPLTWSNTRYYLINDMDDDDFIQNYLPSGAMIPVRYDGSSPDVTDENRCYYTWANYGAIGFSISGTSGEVSFNSNVSWDYNPNNGVPYYRYCFKSVAIHEFVHALGFVSRAESWFEPNYDICPLDIYRFQYTDGGEDYNPDTYTEFQTTPRLVDYNNPEDSHISNIFSSDGLNIEYRMADGDPYQASHFRNGINALMAPAIGGGESLYPDFIKIPDLNMLDAIGWDYAIDTDYDYVPGDANMINGIWPPQIIGGDVTFLVSYFRGISTACLLDNFFCAADVNGDCQIIGSDVTRLVSYFRGTADILYCTNYPPVWLTPNDCPTTEPSGWPGCE
jgi:hypothetical protein